MTENNEDNIYNDNYNNSNFDSLQHVKMQIQLTENDNNFNYQNEEDEEEQPNLLDQFTHYSKMNLNSDNKFVNNEEDNSQVREEDFNENNEHIYTMTVELEPGKSTEINIYRNTNPEELAHRICELYGFDFNIMKFLKEEITKLMIMYKDSKNCTLDNKNSSEYSNKLSNRFMKESVDKYYEKDIQTLNENLFNENNYKSNTYLNQNNMSQQEIENENEDSEVEMENKMFKISEKNLDENQEENINYKNEDYDYDNDLKSDSDNIEQYYNKNFNQIYNKANNSNSKNEGIISDNYMNNEKYLNTNKINQNNFNNAINNSSNAINYNNFNRINYDFNNDFNNYNDMNYEEFEPIENEAEVILKVDKNFIPSNEFSLGANYNNKDSENKNQRNINEDSNSNSLYSKSKDKYNTENPLKLNHNKDLANFNNIYGTIGDVNVNNNNEKDNFVVNSNSNVNENTHNYKSITKMLKLSQDRPLGSIDIEYENEYENEEDNNNDYNEDLNEIEINNEKENESNKEFNNYEESYNQQKENLKNIKTNLNENVVNVDENLNETDKIQYNTNFNIYKKQNLDKVSNKSNSNSNSKNNQSEKSVENLNLKDQKNQNNKYKVKNLQFNNNNKELVNSNIQQVKNEDKFREYNYNSNNNEHIDYDYINKENKNYHINQNSESSNNSLKSKPNDKINHDKEATILNHNDKSLSKNSNFNQTINKNLSINENNKDLLIKQVIHNSNIMSFNSIKTNNSNNETIDKLSNNSNKIHKLNVINKVKETVADQNNYNNNIKTINSQLAVMQNNEIISNQNEILPNQKNNLLKNSNSKSNSENYKYEMNKNKPVTNNEFTNSFSTKNNKQINTEFTENQSGNIYINNISNEQNNKFKNIEINELINTNDDYNDQVIKYNNTEDKNLNSYSNSNFNVKENKTKYQNSTINDENIKKNNLENFKFKNKGEALYYNGIKKKEEFNEKIEKMKSSQILKKNKDSLVVVNNKYRDSQVEINSNNNQNNGKRNLSEVKNYLNKIQKINDNFVNSSVKPESPMKINELIDNPSNNKNYSKNKVFSNYNSKSNFKNSNNRDNQKPNRPKFNTNANVNKDNKDDVKTRLYNSQFNIMHKEELLNQLREKHAFPEEIYNFKPEISTTSYKLARQINPIDYMGRKLKRQEKIWNESNKENTFNPNISKGNKNNYTFEERQIIYKELADEKMNELKKIYSQDVDLNGQKMFKPTLISKKSYGSFKDVNTKINNNLDQLSNMSNLSIINNEATPLISISNNNSVFEKNYNYALKYDKKRKELIEKHNLDIPKHSNTNIDAANNISIYEKIKEEAIENLFNVLDKDNDGIISKFSINIHDLNEKTYRLIEPIINELKVENVTLNLREFSFAITELMMVSF